jgi:hypothetical protein
MYAKLWKPTLNINQLRKETKCVDCLKILEEWLLSFVSHMMKLVALENSLNTVTFNANIILIL